MTKDGWTVGTWANETRTKPNVEPLIKACREAGVDHVWYFVNKKFRRYVEIAEPQRLESSLLGTALLFDREGIKLTWWWKLGPPTPKKPRSARNAKPTPPKPSIVEKIGAIEAVT